MKRELPKYVQTLIIKGKVLWQILHSTSHCFEMYFKTKHIWSHPRQEYYCL